MAFERQQRDALRVIFSMAFSIVFLWFSIVFLWFSMVFYRFSMFVLCFSYFFSPKGVLLHVLRRYLGYFFEGSNPGGVLVGFWIRFL